MEYTRFELVLSACKTDTLPIELIPHNMKDIISSYIKCVLVFISTYKDATITYREISSDFQSDAST